MKVKRWISYIYKAASVIAVAGLAIFLLIALENRRTGQLLKPLGPTISFVLTIVAVLVCGVYWFLMNREYGPRRMHIKRESHRGIIIAIIAFGIVVVSNALGGILGYLLQNTTPIIITLVFSGLAGLLGIGFERFGALRYEIDLIRAMNGKEEIKEVKPIMTNINKEYQNFIKPDKDELKRVLDPLSYRVTQLSETEPPFKNEFNLHFERGIYVDKVSKEPLFLSTDKYECDCGWPSFKKAITATAIVELPDTAHGMERTEVRSKIADSHLGHVFPDGPPPLFQRFCINSAALDFIPADKMSGTPYEKFLAEL